MFDHTKENLVANPAFLGDKSPTGWTFVSPRPYLALNSCVVENRTRRLALATNGDRYAISCWQSEAPLENGSWYRASVRVRMKDIENPHLSIFAQVAQHLLLPKGEWAEETVLEREFQYNEPRDGNKVEFYLRSAAKGSVEWFDPCVQKIAPPKHRMARVATVRFEEGNFTLTFAEQRKRIAEKLDMAGALKPDIVALPEFSHAVGVNLVENNSYIVGAESVPDGPVCQILSAKARQYGMYVLAGIVEQRGKYYFNTAVIFDRSGQLIGRYDKAHLTFDELKKGISLGDSYPVFDLDFGRIGIHICYDEWFPEVARLIALKGAEILFLPVAGGKPITWRTRALDNGIYFVSAGIHPPSMIIDSSGAIIAETHGEGIACADLNLDFRKVNAYVDPTLGCGMPCITPQLRHCIDDGVLDELSDEWKVGK
jgi:predicted amidohydrolase